MSTELLGVVVMYGLTLLLAIPLGKYIANVFKPESANGPIERFIYRLAGIDSSRDMTWKEKPRSVTHNQRRLVSFCLYTTAGPGFTTA